MPGIDSHATYTHTKFRFKKPRDEVIKRFSQDLRTVTKLAPPLRIKLRLNLPRSNHHAWSSVIHGLPQNWRLHCHHPMTIIAPLPPYDKDTKISPLFFQNSQTPKESNFLQLNVSTYYLLQIQIFIKSLLFLVSKVPVGLNGGTLTTEQVGSLQILDLGNEWTRMVDWYPANSFDESVQCLSHPTKLPKTSVLNEHYRSVHTIGHFPANGHGKRYRSINIPSKTNTDPPFQFTRSSPVIRSL